MSRNFFRRIVMVILPALFLISSPAAGGDNPADPCAPYAVPSSVRLDLVSHGAAPNPGIGPLWRWVLAATNVDPAAPPPAVCVLPKPQLERLGAILAGYDSGLVAMYDRANAVILTSVSTDTNEPLLQSVLVHELVHHAQSIARHGFACPAQAEKQAYDLQALWLDNFGLDLHRDFGIDRLALLMLTTCGM